MMKASKKPIIISEYESFIAREDTDNRAVPKGYHSVNQETFDAIENFILSNCNKETGATELMGLSVRKGIGKVITAKNYVGVIALKDGTSIEILPKIYSKEEHSINEVKLLLLKMLKALRDTPYKSIQTTNVNVDKINVLEVFIRMFIDEINNIIKHGLKCGYEQIEGNEPFIKGKIDFSKNIKFNLAHKERTYVVYDEYNVNRPENKLIKSTLDYLYHLTVSPKNKQDLLFLLNCFGEIDYSRDYTSDFSRINLDRNMTEYVNAMNWCEVFLAGKSFTAFSGSKVAYALLFKMEHVFEDYIAALAKKYLNRKGYKVSSQHRKLYLFDKSGDLKLRPDIVIWRKEDKKTFVMDTKWKVLSGSKDTHYGVSVGDMYQMFAYQKKYKAENVTLLYPSSPNINIKDIPPFTGNEGEEVYISMLDLFEKDEHEIIKPIINRVTPGVN